VFEPFIFAFGTLGFWILSVIASIAIIIALDRESGWGAIATLLGFAAAFTLWGSGASIFGWVIANPWVLAGILLGYFVAGTFWGVAKWALKVKKEAFNAREEYLDLKHGFFKKHDVDLVNYKKTPVPEDLQAQWLAYLNGDNMPGWAPKYIKYFNKGKFIPPVVKDYKSTIILWMAFWPLSALWTLIDDFVKELYEYVYRLLADWLQSLSDRAFSNLITMQETDIAKASSTDLVNCPSCHRNLKQDCNDCRGKKKVTLRQYKTLNKLI